MKTPAKSTWIKFAAALALLGCAYLLGYVHRGAPHEAHTAGDHDTTGLSAAVTSYTCSMHPQIQLPSPGKCPICFMDLIPVARDDDEDEAAPVLTVSPAAARLMDIETSPAERRFVSRQLRIAGKVTYDETRVSHLSAWVPGRLDRLFVDYTGITVKKGDHMVSVYSPDLITAQEELLQAIEANKAVTDSDAAFIRETGRATIEASREKLRLAGLTNDQISTLEATGSVSDHITIYAPTGGIVIQKTAQEGMYVQTGTRIYTIADLSQVWVNLDAYESDLVWLRYGQRVSFTTTAVPGVTFAGSIAFISPVLDEATRTVQVRVNAANASGLLKPGMFIRAIVKSELTAEGRVMDTDLAGKWISPMHPEVVKDGPGTCDVCGMPLVPAEELGYAGGQPTDEDKPLVIPASAPLLTGARAIVYVRTQESDRPRFEGRVVTLGPRAGDDYVVIAGLTAGEHVVTRGAFKIDAELQIRARPSMMSPPETVDSQASAQDHQHHGDASRAQTTCPVMGGDINPDVYIDHNGMRIYFCCPGCDSMFKADPEKYIDQMRADGVEPETLK